MIRPILTPIIILSFFLAEAKASNCFTDSTKKKNRYLSVYSGAAYNYRFLTNSNASAVKAFSDSIDVPFLTPNFKIQYSKDFNEKYGHGFGLLLGSFGYGTKYQIFREYVGSSHPGGGYYRIDTVSTLFFVNAVFLNYDFYRNIRLSNKWNLKMQLGVNVPIIGLPGTGKFIPLSDGVTTSSYKVGATKINLPQSGFLKWQPAIFICYNLSPKLNLSLGFSYFSSILPSKNKYDTNISATTDGRQFIAFPYFVSGMFGIGFKL